MDYGMSEILRKYILPFEWMIFLFFFSIILDFGEISPCVFFSFWIPGINILLMYQSWAFRGKVCLLFLKFRSELVETFMIKFNKNKSLLRVI